MLFKEKDFGWSCFSVTSTTQGKYKFYHPVKVDNPFYILYFDFPEWIKIYVCTKEGHIIKTIYRTEIEGSKNEL